MADSAAPASKGKLECSLGGGASRGGLQGLRCARVVGGVQDGRVHVRALVQLHGRRELEVLLLDRAVGRRMPQDQVHLWSKKSAQISAPLLCKASGRAVSARSPHTAACAARSKQGYTCHDAIWKMVRTRLVGAAALVGAKHDGVRRAIGEVCGVKVWRGGQVLEVGPSAGEALASASARTGARAPLPGPPPSRAL